MGVLDLRAWSLGDFLIAVILVAGAIAVTLIILRVMEVQIPSWIFKIVLIVLAVLVGVFAVRLILSL